MKYRIEDRFYDFDGRFTIGEAMLFQDKANLGVNELNRALNTGNPYVLATMMYHLKKRAGEAVRWQDMLALPADSFDMVPETADIPVEEVQRVDPTQTGGEILDGDTTST